MSTCTIVISTYNRPLELDRSLKTLVSLHAKILIVDSSDSTDTERIAKKYKATYIHCANSLMLNINKNYGFSKVTTDWILNLDDDEELTPALLEEIQQKLELNDTSIHGYWLPRKNIIFGKWIRHGVWWPDVQLRLFRKGKGRFPQKHVHEYLQVDGKTETLCEPFVHRNYHSVDQFLHKMEHIYIPSEIARLEESSYVISWYDALRFPLSDFVKLYFFQRGYKDGLHGLVLSMFQAFYMFIVFAKLWEKSEFKEKETSLASVSREFVRRKRDITYWLLTAKIVETKNPILFVWYKLRRRIERLLPL